MHSNAYMEPTFKGTIGLTQGSTYYEIYGPPEEQGREGEWAVCLHGITFWSFCFHNVVERIVAKGYKVLLFDFFGRGQSDAPPIVYNLELFISQTKQVLDHLKIVKLNLIGFSMGGCVAGSFALRYPSMISKLIFVAPAVVPIHVPFAARLMTVPYLGRGLFDMLGKQAMLKKLRTERLSDDFANPAIIPDVIQSCVQRAEWLIEEKNGFLHAFHSTIYNMPLSQGILQELSALSPDIKVYILWGENDKIIPLNSSLQLLGLFPLAKYETIKECGHSCLLEKPEEASKHLITFLGETEMQSKL